MTWGFPQSLELLRDAAALDPMGEDIPMGDLDDMTIPDLDRLVSDMQVVQNAARTLARQAKEQIVDRTGQPDRTGTRHAARVGDRVYVHKEVNPELRWQNPRQALEFLWSHGGAAAVLEACLDPRPRAESKLDEFCRKRDIDPAAFRDTLLAVQHKNPRVELIDLNYEGAPKWAGALPDYMDVEMDCG